MAETVYAVPHLTGRDSVDEGMTLRDYFAGQALEALVASEVRETDVQKFARASYGIADAMLRARAGGA